eukprot:705214_1
MTIRMAVFIVFAAVVGIGKSARDGRSGGDFGHCTCKHHGFVECEDQIDCGDGTVCETRVLHHSNPHRNVHRKCCFPDDPNVTEILDMGDMDDMGPVVGEQTIRINYYSLQIVGVIIIILLMVINCWCCMLYGEKRKNRYQKQYENVQYASSEDVILIK